MAKSGEKRGFGQIRKLPSGRYQARYTGPDGNRHPSPSTYEAKDDAAAWLRAERPLTENPETWEPPKTRAAKAMRRLTFGEYAEAWITGRKVKGQPLAARTRDSYRALLDGYILPTFQDVPLSSITPEAVDHWYELCAVGKATTQAHSYSLLRTILGTAVDRGLIKTANPAKVRGGGSTERAKKVKPATLDELGELAAAMPDRHRLLVLLASWCALRFGELAELRRNDIDTKKGVIHVRRGVVRSAGETIIKKPKSEAGIRDVAIPPHLLPMVRAHLLEHAAPGRDGLLFPGRDGEHLAPSTLYGKKSIATKAGKVTRQGWGFYEARSIAGRDDLRFHDLRHTGAVLAAQTGATLAELMGRLGHATPAAALRYQHAAAERDQEIARRLSAMVVGNED